MKYLRCFNESDDYNSDVLSEIDFGISDIMTSLQTDYLNVVYEIDYKKYIPRRGRYVDPVESDWTGDYDTYIVIDIYHKDAKGSDYVHDLKLVLNHIVSYLKSFGFHFGALFDAGVTFRNKDGEIGVNYNGVKRLKTIDDVEFEFDIKPPLCIIFSSYECDIYDSKERGILLGASGW